MAKSLLSAFADLDAGLKHSLADLDSPRRLALAALHIADETCAIKTLAAEHIVACLEQAGVAVKRISVVRALARAKGCVSTTRNVEGDMLYRLMTKGRREVEQLLRRGSLSVVRIDGNHPRTARKELSEVLQSVNGLVRVCDPYYGLRTLDALEQIPKRCSVRFLTARTGESGRKLKNAIRDFRKERPNVDLRLASKPSELHDRYVVAKDHLLLLGHGLKDMGGKESFLIRLDRKLAPDLIRETIAAFDRRWGKAAVL